MSISNQLNTSLNLTINNNDIKNACTSVTLSKRYIKTLIRIAILNIMYRRMPLPEDEFKQKEYEKIPFVVFKRKSKHPIIRDYHGLVAALIEAIDKNYLKDIHLMFKNSEDIVEYYRFSIKYSEKEKDAVDKFGALKDETIYFFKVLRNLSKHSKLDEVVQPEFEFTYYEETPVDYEPPGFEPSKERLCLKTDFDEGLQGLCKLHTGYHRLACKAKGQIFNAASESIISITNKTGLSTEEKSQNQSDSQTEICESNKFESVENISIASEHSVVLEELNNNNVLHKPKEKVKKKNKILDVSGFTIEDDSEFGINDISSDCISIKSIRVIGCICQLTYSDAIIDTAYCRPCATRYHLPCLGFLDKFSLLTPSFQCKECSPSTYTNDKCLKLDQDNLVIMARVRLFLAILYKEGSFAGFIQILSPEERKTIYARMVSWGIISQTDINTNQPLNINRAKLEHIVSQMLKINDSLVLD